MAISRDASRQDDPQRAHVAAGPPSRLQLAAAYALLALAPVAVYAGRLGGPFVFDDDEAITGNPTIENLGSLAVLQPPRETPVAARPLANLTFAIDRALFGLSPLSFHAVNLALHALAALLVFACLRRLLAAPSLPSAVRTQATAFGWTAALLFAVHPLASEVVLYASQRTEVLGAVFYLLALGITVRAADGGERPRFAVAALIGVLGGASKEVFATAPLAALFLDRAFYAGSFARAWQLRARLYLGLACCVPVLAALQVGDPRPDSVRFGELAYLLAQGPVVAGYFAAVFWPSALAIDHGPLPAAIDLPATLPLVAAVLLVAIAGAVLAFLRPKLGFLAVWVFGILAPSSTLFSIHTEVGADRRFYLPLAGVIAYAVVGAGVWLTRSPSPVRRALALGAAAALALALGATTRSHAASYASERSVWEQVVRAHPRNARGHYNLAETQRRAGDLASAATSFRAALAVEEAYPEAHVNLGNVLLVLGRSEEGIGHLSRGVALAPRDVNARYNLGIALALTGQTDAALDALETAVRLAPDHLEARRKLARAYQSLGRPADARAHAEILARQQPNDPTARNVLRATAD